MSWNPTIAGLVLDMVGFLLVFAFGGFDMGSARLLLQSDNSAKLKPFKIIGATMIIVGFGLQIVGAMGSWPWCTGIGLWKIKVSGLFSDTVS